MEKIQKLEQMIHFLRSNQAHLHADVLLELKNCYSSMVFKNERAFMMYMVWGRIRELPHHPAFAHALTQI
jgi:hypothetical protein